MESEESCHAGQNGAHNADGSPLADPVCHCMAKSIHPEVGHQTALGHGIFRTKCVIYSQNTFITARCTIVQSVVLRFANACRPSVRPSVRLSVYNVNGLGSHRLEIL